jgi:hypothetical protein
MWSVTIQGIEAGAAAFLAILVLAPIRTGAGGLLSAATAGAAACWSRWLSHTEFSAPVLPDQIA